MNWTVLQFSKYKGQTLPQIIFMDPDWFFWACESDIFKKRELQAEAEELYFKARNIRIPGNNAIAEYDFKDGKFIDLEIVDESQPRHEGSTDTMRLDRIDLSIPRKAKYYDKLGYNLLISCIKHSLFGKKNLVMTKKRAEEFFSNSDNFMD